MAKIDIESELLANHTDEELIEFMDGLMTGILRNYNTSAKELEPNILWGNLGDIALVSSLLRGMKKRNTARKVPSEVV